MTPTQPDFSNVLSLAQELGSELSTGGFSVCVYHRGQKALSFSAGMETESKPFNEQSLSVVFSCTKGIAAIVSCMLMDDGLLSPDEPVSFYWPEFAKVSKTLTVSELMQHKAGLSAPRSDLSFEQGINHEFLVNEILNQEPLWEPGTSYAYHALTFGTLLQELALRVSGKTLGQLLQEKIAVPLGIEGYIGVPSDKTDLVSPLIALQPYVSANAEVGSSQYWEERALTLGSAFPTEEIGKAGVGFNSPKLHQAELPGVNGVFSAQALAKIWSATVCETDGVRLLSDQTLSRMTEVLVDEPNVWGESPTVRRGMGVMLHTDGIGEFLSQASFGHDGFGGRAGFADPVHQIGFGYTTNLLHQGEKEEMNWHKLAKELLRSLS
jgi:CubicO group peptidase (beta-lactamase class C family)